LASRAFQISLLLNYLSEIIPVELDFGEEISKILGSSAVTSVSMDYVPKQSKKGEKVRFEGWVGFEQMLKTNKNITSFIPTLKEMHDYLETEYIDLIQFNYTPNFLTLACKFPASRARTFLFIRLKKDCVNLEFNQKVFTVNVMEDFNEEVKTGIKNYFNSYSTKKI